MNREKGSLVNMKGWIRFTSFVFWALLMFGAVTAQETREGYITGKIMAGGGEAISGWRLRFFDMKTGPTPFTHEYWRVPDYIVRSADDGSFSARLPEGTYLLIVIKERAGKKHGLPEEGDFIYPPMDEREPMPYIVRAGETTDIGVISGAVPFKKEWAAQGKTGIEGAILDVNGKPVEGELVFAAPTPGAESPLFVSSSTGKDGKYILKVSEGGRYYLSVRGYRHPIAVTVKTGEITRGIDINLTRTPEPVSQ